MPSSHRRARLSITLLVAVGLLAAAVWTVVALTKSATPPITPTCTAGSYDVDTDQGSVAAQMVGEVYRSRIAHPERAAVLTLAGAYQESKWQNLAPGDGDRDSVGVLQQRPSQDWGKATSANQADTIAARAQRLTNVTEATREFLVKLQTFDSWWTLPVATAVQNVQISADGSLYAQHEPLATAFGDALLGLKPAALNCTFPAPTKVAATSEVVTALDAQLGLTTPVATAQAVRVPGAAWQTASWFVANADLYGIASVDYDGHTWTRTGGWKTSQASATAVLATMAVIKN
jgi:hypothetical protein